MRQAWLLDVLHTDLPLRNQLMTVEEVAELLRMPVATLRYWRVLDSGPRGFIIGRRLRYWRDDVMTWLDAQRESTGSGAT